MMLCLMTAAAEKTTLRLHLKGLPQDTKMVIELAGTFVDEEPLQTVTLRDGQAAFVLDADGPRGYYVHTDQGQGYSTVVLSPGETATLTATYRAEDAHDGPSRYEVTESQVSGSPTHAYYLKNKADREPLNRLYQQYQHDNAEVMAKQAALKGDERALKALYATAEWKKLEQDEKQFFSTVQQTMMAPVYAHKDSWWGPFFLCMSLTYLTAENKTEYDAFTPAARESFYGQVVARFVAPPSIKGRQMPDFEFTDQATGQRMSLYDICARNKYVLVDFWASWCIPCRKEIPNVKAQYERFHAKGFDVVSISADTNRNAWLKALEAEQLPWPNDIDGTQGICRRYEVSAYPTVYLLDTQGKAVARDMDVRGEALQRLLEQLLP